MDLLTAQASAGQSKFTSFRVIIQINLDKYMTRANTRTVRHNYNNGRANQRINDAITF